MLEAQKTSDEKNNEEKTSDEKNIENKPAKARTDEANHATDPGPISAEPSKKPKRNFSNKLVQAHRHVPKRGACSEVRIVTQFYGGLSIS